MNEKKKGKGIIPLEEGVQLFARENGVGGFPDIAYLINEMIEEINYLRRESITRGEMRDLIHKIALAKAKFGATHSKGVLSGDK